MDLGYTWKLEPAEFGAAWIEWMEMEKQTPSSWLRIQVCGASIVYVDGGKWKKNFQEGKVSRVFNRTF